MTKSSHNYIANCTMDVSADFSVHTQFHIGPNNCCQISFILSEYPEIHVVSRRPFHGRRGRGRWKGRGKLWRGRQVSWRHHGSCLKLKSVSRNYPDILERRFRFRKRNRNCTVFMHTGHRYIMIWLHSVTAFVIVPMVIYLFYMKIVPPSLRL